MNRIRHSRRWILAFTLSEIMAVSAIVTSIPAGAYVRAKQKAIELQCKRNLQQIGQAIIMYEMGQGHYPDAKFFPEKPAKDPKSIMQIMKNAGAGLPKTMWICPAAPTQLSQKQLTFVYNDTFAGRTALREPSRAWLLIEVNCVSNKVPPPHPGGYNILFADGHVVTTRQLPTAITRKQRAAVESLRRELEGARHTSCEQAAKHVAAVRAEANWQHRFASLLLPRA